MGFLNSEKLILGYDLGNEFFQISFSTSKTGEVETLSQVAGDQQYNIPAVLCKKSGTNQWFYGKEALRQAKEQDGILVQDLLALALDGEAVIIEGESLDPVALLTLFIKKSLGLLSAIASPDRIGAMMFTGRAADRRIYEVLAQVASGLELKADKVDFQSHMESFYVYMLRQPLELRNSQALLLDYTGDSILSYRLEFNRRTKPVTVFVDEKEHSFHPSGKRGGEMDGALLGILEELCGQYPIGSAFLIGDFFDRSWMKESLRFLCKNRRVFQGNNLFSKGACFGMQAKLSPEDVDKEYVFLGQEKLKANVGMKLLRQGEESYYAILDAGTNWYEAEHSFEFYLQEGNTLPFVITPLMGQGPRIVEIILEDFPGGPSRLKGNFYPEEERFLRIELEDLGFGEIRPGSGKKWSKRIELY